MKILTTQLADNINQLLLLAVIVFALFRLTDGMRELLYERVVLLAMMVGAFFLLSTNAHPAGGVAGSGIVHPVIMLCQYTFLYFKYKSSDRWTSM